MGSPFTARLCTLVADRLARGIPVADQVLDWPGDPSNRGDALPLRLAGALHALALDGTDPGLVAAYPPDPAPDDDALWTAVLAALERHEAFVLRRLEGPPQTNETMRSAALAPGFLTIAAETGLPLVCSEIGSSAGLNLCWDRFRYDFGGAAWGDAASGTRLAPDWTGAAPPRPAATVVERAGCDRAPLDPADPQTEARLASFVWADQPERLARLRAALAIARADPPDLARADAADWLDQRLADPRPGRAHVVSHSIVWQYLPPATQARIAGSLDAAGARATADSPLAWLRLEPDGGAPGAAVTLTLWPGGASRVLARADFHGRWVDWRGPESQRLWDTTLNQWLRHGRIVRPWLVAAAKRGSVLAEELLLARLSVPARLAPRLVVALPAPAFAARRIGLAPALAVAPERTSAALAAPRRTMIVLAMLPLLQQLRVEAVAPDLALVAPDAGDRVALDALDRHAHRSGREDHEVTDLNIFHNVTCFPVWGGRSGPDSRIHAGTGCLRPTPRPINIHAFTAARREPRRR